MCGGGERRARKRAEREAKRARAEAARREREAIARADNRHNGCWNNSAGPMRLCKL